MELWIIKYRAQYLHWNSVLDEPLATLFALTFPFPLCHFHPQKWWQPNTPATTITNHKMQKTKCWAFTQLPIIRDWMNIKPHRISIMLHTDDIFVGSELDLRACEIGVTDSLNISCALSPLPAVRANNPTKIYYKIVTVSKLGENSNESTRRIKRLTNGMSR